MSDMHSSSTDAYQTAPGSGTAPGAEGADDPYAPQTGSSGPYPDYRPSAAPGHPQPPAAPAYPTYPEDGQAYSGPYPSPFPARPGGYPAAGHAPYPYYAHPGGYYPYHPGYMLPMHPLPPDAASLPGAGPVEAVKRFFQRYAQFRGYASRSEYWWVLGVDILMHIGMIALIILISHQVRASDEPTPAQIAVGVLYFCYWAATFVPMLALSSRRLHDTGNPGLLLIMLFIPGLNYFSWIIILILCSLPSHPERYRLEWT